MNTTVTETVISPSGIFADGIADIVDHGCAMRCNGNMLAIRVTKDKENTAMHRHNSLTSNRIENRGGCL